MEPLSGTYRCKAWSLWNPKNGLPDKKRLEGGRNMAWIIGAAIFIILFLTVMFVIAGIAVSVAGSYQTD